MKFRTFATVATSLLGAALMSYGQGAQQGAGSSGQMSGGATGTTGGRSQSTTDRAAAYDNTRDITPGQAGATQESQRRQAAQQSGQQQTGQQAQAQDPTEQRSAAEWAQRAEALRNMNWDGAQIARVRLNETPQRVRDTINSVTSGQQLDEQLTKLTKDGHEVYRATVNRANEQDLHILVQADGSVIETRQNVDLSDAPQTVQTAVRQQLGGADAKPKQFQRVIANEQTFYVATSGEGDQAKIIRVDNSGKIINLADPQGQQDTKDRD